MTFPKDPDHRAARSVARDKAIGPGFLIAAALGLAIIASLAQAQQPMLGYTPRTAPDSVNTAEPAPSSAPAAKPVAKSEENDATTSGATAAGGRAPVAANPDASSRPSAAAVTTTSASTNTGLGKDASANPFSKLTLSDHGPIDIHSDSLAMSYKDSMVNFTGHVHVEQGSTTLTSDTLSVIYGKNLHEIKEIIAQGNVRLAQGGRWATGERAVLNQVDRTVEMTGDPVIHDGPDQVAGRRILIYLDSEKTQIDGARAVIFPRKSETGDNNFSADHGP